MDDNALLREYAENGSEVAFTEFVQRHLGLVYGAALRQVGGDAYKAQDVSQSVFADAARKAGSLCRHPAPAAWLYASTRHAALNLMRAERRRSARHEETRIMTETQHTTDIDWNELRPVLDDAMHRLGERERTALLLRYFEQRPMEEVGARLGMTERGARKLLDRGLEQLRGKLFRVGITSSAAALAACLDGVRIHAPSELVPTIAKSALSAGPSKAGLALAMGGSTKFGIGAALVALSFFAGSLVASRLTPPPPARAAAVAPPPVSSLSVQVPTAPEKPPITPELARGIDIAEMINEGLLDGVRLQAQVAPDQVIPATLSGIGRILDISAGEVSALQEAAASAYSAVNAAVASSASVTRTADNQVEIELTDLSGARAIQDELDRKLLTILGPDRWNAFDRLGGTAAIHNRFRATGLFASKISVVRKTAARGTAGQYTIFFDPDPSGARKSGDTDTNVLGVMGTLSEKLPADF